MQSIDEVPLLNQDKNKSHFSDGSPVSLTVTHNNRQ